MKIPVIKRNEYIVYYENVEGNMFLHCDCYKWNKTVKRKIITDLDKLKELYKDSWFALNTFNDSKRYKFLNMVGFSFLKQIIGTDGNSHQIFVRN